MAMAGYTKLFNSILASTIWRAPDKTRIVWITMLAMADKDGVVEGSIPGLADFARVSLEDCEAAIKELESPDNYSRSSEHEGRRIEGLDGTGWRLLNHAKYRAKMDADERRTYNARKQAEWRLKNKLSNNVIDSQSQSAMSAQAAPAPAPAPAPEEIKTKTLSAKADALPVGFVSFWKEWPSHDRKEGKSNCLKIWKSRKLEPLAEEILKALDRAKGSPDWTKDSGAFIPMPQTWLNKTPWESNGEAIQVGPKYADESRVEW